MKLFGISVRYIFIPLVGLALPLLLSSSGIGQEDDPVFNTGDMDRSIRVQDDLFRHVNGTWLQKTEIPEDKSVYGSVGKLADLSQVRIKKIITKLLSPITPRAAMPRRSQTFTKVLWMRIESKCSGSSL